MGSGWRARFQGWLRIGTLGNSTTGAICMTCAMVIIVYPGVGMVARSITKAGTTMCWSLPGDEVDCVEVPPVDRNRGWRCVTEPAKANSQPAGEEAASQQPAGDRVP
jgi:hypothetical protein